MTIPVLSELDEKWCKYSEEFIEQQAKADKPWLLYHCTRGAHFDNYPHEKFLGKSPAKHPYKDTMHRARRHHGPPGRGAARSRASSKTR